MDDPRINFVCLDFPDIVEHIDFFDTEDTVNDKLDSFVSELLNDKVNIDSMQGEIVLPKLMQTYREDFGGSDESLLRFVFKYYSAEEVDEDLVIKEVCHRKSMMIRYE